MANDYLYLRPLEKDERLIQSLIEFCNQDYQPRPGAELQPSVYQRLDSCRSRLNSFIDETCKSVVNASCPVDDYPQQYQLNQYHQQQLSQQQNQQQPFENVLSQQVNSNSQYQAYQMTHCPQFYQPADSNAKLNTIYDPSPSYYLNQSAVIHPLPTTDPCFRVVSSQSDLDCQLMEPPIIPATNFANAQSSQVNRRPFGEIQNQSRFNQPSAASFDDSYAYPYDYPNYSSEPYESGCFALELNSQYTSTQQPNYQEPAEFRILPDALAGYFYATGNQASNRTDSQVNSKKGQPNSQDELEVSLANSQELIKMLRYSKIACSQVRYSPKRLLYLNGLEKLRNNELQSRMSSKPVQDQVKRIQKKNRQLRMIKFKNRDTKNIGLRNLFSEARKLDLEERARRIKHLILDLEPKVTN